MRQSFPSAAPEAPEATPGDATAAPGGRARRHGTLLPLEKPAASQRDGAREQAEQAAAVCPRCDGIGYYRVPDPSGDPLAPALTRRCECRAEERRRWLIAHSGLTDAMLRVTFADLREDAAAGLLTAAARAALIHLEAFAERPEGWVLLRGRTGTNKTRLLSALAHRLIERQVEVFYQVTPEFLDTVRAAYDPQVNSYQAERRESAEALIQTAIDAEVLLLDDLGVEQDTAWVAEKLYRIIDARYRAERPTVVATNAAPGMLERRIESRLVDERLSMTYLFTGADQRMADHRRAHPALDPWDRGEGE